MSRGDRRQEGVGGFHAGKSCRVGILLCEPAVDGPLLGLPGILFCHGHDYTFIPPKLSSTSVTTLAQELQNLREFAVCT